LQLLLGIELRCYGLGQDLLEPVADLLRQGFLVELQQLVELVLAVGEGRCDLLALALLAG
jgi:hypothetical protein